MVGLTGIQSTGSAWGSAPGSQAVSRRQASGTGTDQDSLEISSRAQELGRRTTRQSQEAKPLPPFGQFNLAPQPLPFGPDLEANILDRIPGDGIREPAHGVQLGHQPARGLNILA